MIRFRYQKFATDDNRVEAYSDNGLAGEKAMINNQNAAG
jgi:hypothetical protein